jgi:hypothetical protein
VARGRDHFQEVRAEESADPALPKSGLLEKMLERLESIEKRLEKVERRLHGG